MAVYLKFHIGEDNSLLRILSEEDKAHFIGSNGGNLDLLGTKLFGAPSKSIERT